MLLITNDVLFDQNLSDNDVMIYTFLKILTFSENYESCLFNVGEIVDQIYGEVNSHSISGMITKSLTHLMDKGYILTKKKNSCNWHIFMTSYNLTDADIFTVFNPGYLRKIIDSEFRNKPSILRFYMVLMSTVRKDTKVGIYDYSWFADRMKLSTSIVSRYVKALEELELIYVYRSADFYISNTYGDIKDKKLIDQEGMKRSNSRRAHENANEKRKYVAMYQNFINGKDYPICELQEIYEHMKKRNDEIKKIGVNARASAYDLQPLIDKIKEQC